MKRNKIAVLLAAAMVASGVTAPVEATYAADNIQAAETVDLQDTEESPVQEDTAEDFSGESTEINSESTDAGELTAESTDTEAVSAETTDVDNTNIGAAETTDIDQQKSDEVEIGEETSDDEDETFTAEFSDDSTDVAGDSQEVIKEGYCGDTYSGSEDYQNTSYKLYADGRLVIEGKGKVATYDLRENANIRTIQISEGITILGEGYSNLFSECKNLTSVTLPSTLTSIGSATFYNCASLTNISIPEGVTSIGDRIFSGCTNLADVSLPESLTSMGDSAFQGCTSLTNIHIPSKITSIGLSTFYNCKKLENIDLPDNLTSLGNAAFYSCAFKSFDLPDTLTSIDTYVFYECKNLRSVTLPKGITKISDGMFDNCSRLNKITLPESVITIGENAFSGCIELTELTFPKNLTTIEKSAFNYTGLLSVNLPDSLTTIGDYAFQQTKFTEITLPESLTSLGEGAFAYNDKLESINIPKNIKELKKTFYDDSKLKFVSLPEGLTKIDDAFGNCSSLETLTVPSTVIEIGEKTFKYCYRLTEIKLPDNLTEIGYQAFYGCEKLTNISIPDNVTEIDTGAFNSCPKLVSIYIPGTDVTINTRAMGYNTDTEINEKLVIIGKAGSNAETYAKNLGIHFHNVADPLTHQTRVNASCIKDGNVEYWHCDTCGQNFSNSEGTAALDVTTIAKTFHKKVYVDYVDATCTQPGHRGYFHCVNCGRNFWNGYDGDDDNTLEDMTIPAKGHDWEWRNTGSSYTGINNVKTGVTRPVYVSESVNRERYCRNCGQVSTREHTDKTLNVNIDQITLKCGQSSAAFRVSGDPIKSIVPTSKLVKVSGLNKNGTFKVTAHSKMTGNAYITITTTTGLMAQVEVFVQNIPVKTKSIKGLSKSATLEKGRSLTLKPTLEPANSPEKITYSSSNKSVATVSAKGVIKAKKAGTAKITVKSGKKKTVIKIKVTGVKTKKLSGVPAAKNISKGKTFRIKAKTTPKNTDEKITYKSSNKKVVTVTSKGVVKGLRKGTATITVRSGSRKMTCKVTVK